MTNKKTQVEKILSHFAKGKQLTESQASRMGIGNLRARISDMRYDGWTIYTNRKTVNGSKVTHYNLLSDERQEAAARIC